MQQDNTDDKRQVPSCPVCLSEHTDTLEMFMICGHTLCMECCMVLEQEDESVDCPICRRNEFHIEVYLPDHSCHICSGHMEAALVLNDCSHSFCVDCCDNIEEETGEITCPICNERSKFSTRLYLSFLS